MSENVISLERDLISDIEMLSSSLSAGLSQIQAIKLIANRSSQSWRPYFAHFANEVEREGLALSVIPSKQVAAHPSFDILLELLAAEARFGNTNLAATLNSLALRMRKSVAIKTQVIQRISAVRNVGKIALVAPWLVLLVLCSRTENLNAFATAQGLLVPIAGVTLCLIAYLLMKRLSQLPKEPRMFSL